MIKNILSAGCSFTFGNELSDDVNGKKPSKKTWAALQAEYFANANHTNIAVGGIGNQAIARKVFEHISFNQVDFVQVMWTFPSRYDWAMPRNKMFEKTRWVSITPWDTDATESQVFKILANSEPQQEIWKKRKHELAKTGVREFANSLYKHAANQYHEIYLSWKSITWLENFLKAKKIPYFFTCADNTLFYHEREPHREMDRLLQAMHDQMDFSSWFFFGERRMGFNQWALLNDYERATTHPLDKAHQDAVKLMKDTLLLILKKHKCTIKLNKKGKQK